MTFVCGIQLQYPLTSNCNVATTYHITHWFDTHSNHVITEVFLNSRHAILWSHFYLQDLNIYIYIFSLLVNKCVSIILWLIYSNKFYYCFFITSGSNFLTLNLAACVHSFFFPFWFLFYLHSIYTVLVASNGEFLEVKM